MANSRHSAVAVLALVASACRISTGLGGSRPAHATAEAQASARSGGGDASSDHAPSEKLGIHHSEMASLPGLTIEQARRRLREFGHVGEVTIEELHEFHAGCRPGTVCSTSHLGGTSIDAPIVLRVNRSKLGIPAPPP
jgi:hypothetical protein